MLFWIWEEHIIELVNVGVVGSEFFSRIMRKKFRWEGLNRRRKD